MDLDLIKSLFSSKIETYFQQFNVSNPFLKNFREFNQELVTKTTLNIKQLSFRLILSLIKNEVHS